MLGVVLFGLFVVQASGVIYRLSPEEYNKMPIISKLDRYEPCMMGPGDAYCYVHANLIGNLSNPIYNLTVEYSATKITHYNHLHIHWGICLKETCSQFMNVSTNLTEVTEACLNNTLTRDYDMTARVYDIRCEEHPVIVKYDNGDYIFGAVVLALLVLNLLGSLYDFQCGHGKDTSTLVGRVFLCFSIRRNWKRLVAPSSGSKMQLRVRVLHAFRTITALFVILGHSPLIAMLMMGNNPQYVEEVYYNPFYLFLFSGTIIVQTFFLMSGFLLAYNNLLAEVKKPATWQNFHLAVIQRWLRLTPAYAFVLFYVMTWARHYSGPHHMVSVLPEVDDCYRDWWRHLTYIYNYEDNSQCMVHAWYISADFQLSILGMIIFSFIHNNKIRKIAIGVMIVAGLLTTAAHTYFQKLNAILVVSPEVGFTFFITDPTFNNLYKRGHTNLVCYGLGLGAAYIIFNLKDSDIGAEKYKKYRLFYWLLFPIMGGVWWLGAIFYIEGLDIPTAVSVVYSGGVKLVFGCLSVIFLFFTIVKVDTACRGVLHWPGWARIARLTYIAYIIHVPIMRFMAAATTDTELHMSVFWFTQNYIAILGLSFLLAVPLFLLIESPLAEIIKVLMAPAPRSKEKPVKTVGHITSSKDTIELKL